MTDPNLQLTPEEKASLEQDARIMGLLKEVNSAQQSSFSSIFADSIPMSALQYWSVIRKPDAIAHLKQLLLRLMMSTSTGAMDTRPFTGPPRMDVSITLSCFLPAAQTSQLRQQLEKPRLILLRSKDTIR